MMDPKHTMRIKPPVTTQQMLSANLLRYEKLHRDISDTKSEIDSISRQLESDILSSANVPGYKPIHRTVRTLFKALEGQRLTLISQQREISLIETKILRYAVLSCHYLATN